MTDAPVDLADQFTLTGFHEAGLSPADSAIALLVVRRILRDSELHASRAAPPADEVVRDLMLEFVETVRLSPLNRRAVVALDRLENHLKGQR